MENLKRFWNARTPKQKIWIPIVSLLLVIGSVGNAISPFGSEETATTRTDVQWENYAAEVKIRLDEMMEAKDCEGLRAQSEISESNNAATLNRVGHDNSKLISYTDEAMKIAGCP